MIDLNVGHVLRLRPAVDEANAMIDPTRTETLAPPRAVTADPDPRAPLVPTRVEMSDLAMGVGERLRVSAPRVALHIRTVDRVSRHVARVRVLEQATVVRMLVPLER